MTSEEKNKLVDDYLKSVDLFKDFIKDLNGDILTFRPFPEAWTIKEHIIHTIDGDINAFLRLKFLIAESGKTVIVIDEEKWTKNLKYHDESIDDYIEILLLLRKIASNFIRNLDDVIWETNYIIHPDFGKLKLKEFLNVYTKHIYDHLNFIKRNIELYKGK